MFKKNYAKICQKNTVDLKDSLAGSWLTGFGWTYVDEQKLRKIARKNQILFIKHLCTGRELIKCWALKAEKFSCTVNYFSYGIYFFAKFRIVFAFFRFIHFREKMRNANENFPIFLRNVLFAGNPRLRNHISEKNIKIASPFMCTGYTC